MDHRLNDPPNTSISIQPTLGVCVVFPDISRARTHMTMRVSTCTNGHLQKLNRPGIVIQLL
jgi:hypothetical protein